MGIAISSPFKCVRLKSSSSSHSRDAEFERLFTTSIRKRTPKWCRLCLNETCYHESSIHHSLPTIPADDRSFQESQDSVFDNRLNVFKQKRQDIHSFIQQVGEISQTYSLQTVRYIYSGPLQYGIPLPLMAALSKENFLKCYLIPLFPVSEKTLQEASTNVARLSVIDPDVSKEYFMASQFDHRIRIGLSAQNPNDLTALNTFPSSPSFCVFEDIDKPSTQKEPPDCCKDQLGKRQRLQRNVDATDRIAEDMVMTSGGNTQHNGKGWKVLFECCQASIVECRFGRILIKGDFLANNRSPLPFQLTIFPGLTSHNGVVCLSGTFSRQMKSSKFFLRWKFNVKVKV